VAPPVDVCCASCIYFFFTPVFVLFKRILRGPPWSFPRFHCATRLFSPHTPPHLSVLPPGFCLSLHFRTVRSLLFQRDLGFGRPHHLGSLIGFFCPRDFFSLTIHPLLAFDKWMAKAVAAPKVSRRQFHTFPTTASLALFPVQPRCSLLGASVIPLP